MADAAVIVLTSAQRERAEALVLAVQIAQLRFDAFCDAIVLGAKKADVDAMKENRVTYQDGALHVVPKGTA